MSTFLDENLIDRWNIYRDHEAIYDLYKNYERFMNYLVYKRFRGLSEKVRDLDPIFNRSFYAAIKYYDSKRRRPDSKLTFIGYLTYVVKMQLKRMRYEERKLNGQVSLTNISFKEPTDCVSMSIVDNKEFILHETDRIKQILSPEEFEIVELKFGEGKKNCEISSKFGVSPQAISKSIHRILDKIKESTEKELIDRINNIL